MRAPSRVWLRLTSFVAFALCSAAAAGQQPSAPTGLPMALEFKRAYARGTRGADGAPTATYWQNRARYDLKARIDPATRLLYGQARIHYFNHSPDTLRSIVFHAYQDIYRRNKGNFGFRRYPLHEKLGEGIQYDYVIAAGDSVNLTNRRQAQYGGTHYAVTLRRPLLPRDSVELQVAWRYRINDDGGREGAFDSTSYFVAYWYPEIAVYDDIDGWDRVLYDGPAEFYHDLSDYTVEIEAPSTFLVWASAPLLNAADIYPERIRQRLDQARTSTTAVTIVDSADHAAGLGLRSNRWRYRAQGYPDFAFALSDHFVWQAGSYTDSVGRFELHSAYHPRSREFRSVIESQRRSLKIFHTRFPAQPFPYRHFVVFNGSYGGGMEFPGMANNSNEEIEPDTPADQVAEAEVQASLGLTLHEMCHMYFPFLMGINEKKYAWMDEGMANFSDYFITLSDSQQRTNSVPFLAQQALGPMMIPTWSNGIIAGANSYTIASMSYAALYHMLGPAGYRQALSTYVNTWKGKHPTPYDYFFTINRATGRDLNWFWRRWYFDWGYCEVELTSFDKNVLTLTNLGGRPVALQVEFTHADGSLTRQLVSPSVWEKSDVFTLKVKPRSPVVKARLLLAMRRDVDMTNNAWPRAK